MSTIENLNPIISIVIPCYNDADYIEKSVLSAVNQTYKYKEIILIDDGSNKLTKNVIQGLKDKIDHLIVQENQGQSIARNRGISKAKGKYILVLDSDDFFEPRFCELAVSIIEKDSGVKLITSYARRFNYKGTINIAKPKGGNIENFLFENAALGSVLFKKENWADVGGYDENSAILGFEDWEFYIRLLKTGGKAYIIPEVLFNYQIREKSTSGRIQSKKKEKFNYIILTHKELYIKNFEKLMNHLLILNKNSEKEYSKIIRTWDYKIGKTLLKPIRKIKSILFRIN